jgi:hypothetical protein
MPDLLGSAEMGESPQCSHRSLIRTEAGHLLCAQGKFLKNKKVEFFFEMLGGCSF